MCIRDRWKSPKGKGFYKLPKAGTEFTSSELIAHWKSLVEKMCIRDSK